MDSVMEALAGDFKRKAAIGIVDKRERRLFMMFRIKGIPQFFVFRNGQVKEHFNGALPKNVLAKALKRHQK
jgi:thioredoxin-like negative regulator of GroEL